MPWLLSGEDVGPGWKGWALGKKHKDFLGGLERPGDGAPGTAGAGLPQGFQDSPDVINRLQALRDLCSRWWPRRVRRQRLQDAWTCTRCLGETDACRLWMGEKGEWPGPRWRSRMQLEDLEVVQHRSELASLLAHPRLSLRSWSQKQPPESARPSLRGCQMPFVPEARAPESTRSHPSSGGWALHLGPFPKGSF